jgi:hypothetical protein
MWWRHGRCCWQEFDLTLPSPTRRGETACNFFYYLHVSELRLKINPMKIKFLLPILASIVFWSSCMVHPFGKSKIKYTPMAQGMEMSIKPFTAIKANGVFNLVIQKGATESVVVKDNYPSDLKVTNTGNTLIIMDTISDHNGIDSLKTNIYVTYRKLNHLEIETVGKTETMDTIKAAKFNFESYGVGESILFLNADSAEIYESGVGAISISGEARYASFDENGVGALKAKNFIADSLHVTVNGVGAATVYATHALYMHVDGIGGVKYYGPAKVVVQESSGIGKIERGE